MPVDCKILLTVIHQGVGRISSASSICGTRKKNPLIFICLEPRLQTKQFGWILTCEQLHLFSKLSKWWDNIIIIHWLESYPNGYWPSHTCCYNVKYRPCSNQYSLEITLRFPNDFNCNINSKNFAAIMDDVFTCEVPPPFFSHWIQTTNIPWVEAPGKVSLSTFVVPHAPPMVVLAAQ